MAGWVPFEGTKALAQPFAAEQSVGLQAAQQEFFLQIWCRVSLGLQKQPQDKCLLRTLSY